MQNNRINEQIRRLNNMDKRIFTDGITNQTSRSIQDALENFNDRITKIREKNR